MANHETEGELGACRACGDMRGGLGEGALFYVCKYTPVELLRALGARCENLNREPAGFELAEQVAHPNLCGFGKALLQAVMEGEIRELVLVNCCDVIRSVYDVLEDSGQLDFLYMIDVLRSDDTCSREYVAREFAALARAWGDYKHATFDEEAFRAAFKAKEPPREPYISVLGARMGEELLAMTQEAMPLPVRNDTCVNNRLLGAAAPPDTHDFEELMAWYAGELLAQTPCMRMMDHAGRKRLFADPYLAGVIYHTVKFCDFYSFEYAQVKSQLSVPILKIESDWSRQSEGQLATRLEAFAEGMARDLGLRAGAGASCGAGAGSNAGWSVGAGAGENLDANSDSGEGTGEGARNQGERRRGSMGKGYVAGIDSGSTSTDVVILDAAGDMAASVILPTGAGAAAGAERALAAALAQAGLCREDLDAVVATGYGREAIQLGDKAITEITCHARGAHHLDPSVRTIIDIGGQDSKVICVDEAGSVVNFVMNDKCAAGTGRFLEMMARTLEMSLDELAGRGLRFSEDITISSMCSVFAESEVVSLVAQNKATDDIVHGLNKAVAVKTCALAKRAGGKPAYMMTGGVSRNCGLVKTLEEALGAPLAVSEHAQLCGALGAALFAADMMR